MLDVRRLRILREVAACGTIAAAADALHLTASAVSQQLATLERESGETVVERHGRGVRLTAAGRVLVEHAHQVIAQLERAEADLAALHAGAVGTLRLRTFPTAGIGLVAPALRTLAERHPRLTLEVEESDAAVDASAVTSGDFDIALALLLPGTAGLDDPGVIAIRLIDDPYDLALPVGHRLAARDAVPLAALADERWILPQGETAWEANVRLACATAGFTPRVAHRAGEYLFALALVQAGAGVTLVPRLAHASAPSGVVMRPLADAAAVRRVGVLVRRGGESHPGIAAVLATLRDVAAETVVAYARRASGGDAAGADASRAARRQADAPGPEHTNGRRTAGERDTTAGAVRGVAGRRRGSSAGPVARGTTRAAR